ncbi:hypothetical protein HDE_03143 [Halotydeus destructor]|nr:hypothetical protein HDE_03143 [Halotydeus destructor]
MYTHLALECLMVNLQPRLFPMNSPRSQLSQPPPPSPPLPPPPPPQTSDSGRPASTSTSGRTSSTTSNCRVHGASYITVNTDREVPEASEPFEKTPTPRTRQRSLSKEEDEIVLKADRLKARQHKVSSVKPEVDSERPRHLPKHQVLLRKPGNLFIAQLYFLFHLALTICLLRANDSTKRGNKVYLHEAVLYYYSYLLGVSILFIFLIRCCKTDYSRSQALESRNTAVLLGSIALGLIQLISIGLDFAQCVHDNFIFLPILQFMYVFLLMHFVLTQARRGPKLGFSNIAVAHLLTTQVSLWVINFDPNYGACGYSDGLHVNGSKFALEVAEKKSFPFANLLLPVIHHYQLLTIFILIGMWFMNNDLKLTAYSGSNFKDTFGYNYFNKRASIKGFFLGLLVISATIIVLILQDNTMSLTTHTAIQGLSAIVSMIGLILRGKKMRPIYKSPVTNLPKPNEGQLIIFVTILATFYCAILMIMSNLLARNMNMTAICDGLVMVIHITFQTYLLRSADREKNNGIREIFAFLILANFSLWLLEVSQVALKASHLGPTDILILPPLLMSLNRFYSALVFMQYWK